MHCATHGRRAESYIGLVEAGVGLLPAGGGSAKSPYASLQRRRRRRSPRSKRLFETVAQAKTSAALEAKQRRVAASGRSVFNGFELLYVAKKSRRRDGRTGYRPPLPAIAVTVAGDVGLATLRMALVNMLEGRFTRTRRRDRDAHRRDVLLRRRSNAARSRSTRNGCSTWSASTSSNSRRCRRRRSASCNIAAHGQAAQGSEIRL